MSLLFDSAPLYHSTTQMRAVPPIGAVERWGPVVEPVGVPQAPIDKARYAVAA